MLKLLIALGGEAVPVARLCAALWPEADGDAGARQDRVGSGGRVVAHHVER